MGSVKRRGDSTGPYNQMNILLPAETFTDEATNFWFGMAFGVGICIVSYAAMRR